MHSHVVAPDAATAAVRVRSILSATDTAAITRVEDTRTSVQAWVREYEDRLLLTPITPGEPWFSVKQPLPAVVEVADVAPVSAADRVRARVRFDGPLIRDESNPETVWHHLAEKVSLEEGGQRHRVPLGTLLGACPDPLAHVEGSFLAHLDRAHPEAAGLLARLVSPGLLQGVTRVRPWRLDQHGLVLRLWYARGHRDVRLPFPAPAPEPHALNAAMRTLLDRARHQHRGCRRRPTGE